MRVGMNSSAVTPRFDIRGFRSSRRPFGAAKFISAVLTYMASGSLLADISVLILSSKWSGISSWVTLILGYLVMKSVSYFLTREFSVGLPPQLAARIVPVTSASFVAPPPALLPPPQAASSTDPTAASAKPSRIDRMNSPPRYFPSSPTPRPAFQPEYPIALIAGVPLSTSVKPYWEILGSRCSGLSLAFSSELASSASFQEAPCCCWPGWPSPSFSSSETAAAGAGGPRCCTGQGSRRPCSYCPTFLAPRAARPASAPVATSPLPSVLLPSRWSSPCRGSLLRSSRSAAAAGRELMGSAGSASGERGLHERRPRQPAVDDFEAGRIAHRLNPIALEVQFHRAVTGSQVAQGQRRQPVGKIGIDVHGPSSPDGMDAAEDRDQAEHRRRRPGLRDIGAEVRHGKGGSISRQPAEELG